jgi:SAM-dependent methyltransferase
MPAEPYETLAAVYDFLVPEPLLTPQGSAEAFAPYLDPFEPGARVLDCAAGTGPLAVGLALRGFDVVASDASPAMVARIRELAARHGAAVTASACAWDDLGGQGWAPFHAVLCVGNSLTHAPGRDGRRRALRAMAAVLRPGGLLLLTSRNWELVREAGSGLRVGEELTVRAGARGLVVHAWSLGAEWEDVHHLDVAVALLGDDGRVATHRERLAFWPFRHETLDDDLRAAGLVPHRSTYAAGADRYLVSARRPASAASTAARPGRPARTPSRRRSPPGARRPGRPPRP